MHILAENMATSELGTQSVMTNFNFTQRINALVLFCLMSLSYVSGQTLVLSCPGDLIVDVNSFNTLSEGTTTQDLVDAAFEDWIIGFRFVNNGCSPVATGKEGLVIPSATFGGSLNVTYTVTDNCGNTETCSGAFNVIGSVISPIIVSCPPDLQLDNTATQFQVDSAFNVWVNSFSSFPVSALTTDLTALVPPVLGGDPVQVTYIAEDPSDPNNIGTCSSTFIPPSSSLTNGNDEIPTMGEWGVISLCLLLLIFSVIGIRSTTDLTIKVL